MPEDLRPLSPSQKRCLLALTEDDMTINDLMASGAGGNVHAAMSVLEMRGLIRIQRSAMRSAPNLHSLSVTGGAMQARLRAEGFEIRMPGNEDDDRLRVTRDPCPRCGVRGDIGCAHGWTPRGLAVR